MLKASQIRTLNRGLTAALLSGPWQEAAITERMQTALGQGWQWIPPLVRELVGKFEAPPDAPLLSAAIDAAAPFRAAISNLTRPHIMHWFLLPTAMGRPFPEWGLPRLDCVDDLGRLLELPYEQLTWLADVENRGGGRHDRLRQHYRSQWQRKRTGGWRLLEEPLPILKRAQRVILHDLLDRVPPHPAACGSCASRSIVDYAGAHVGQGLVMRLDLKAFFPSIPASRLHALFTTLGYPTNVARLLTGLCTSSAPSAVCRQHRGGQTYSAPHLPQGAPTSPALANLAAFRLDRRLTAACASMGVTYTRYVDDLAFSGGDDFARDANRFLSMLWRIIREEGFEVNHRKTRLMVRSNRQKLCGVVVNDHVNMDRRDYDRLKATLTNCIRHGLASQNRDHHPDFAAHLQGRVAHAQQLNPARGTRLRGLLVEALQAT